MALRLPDSLPDLCALAHTAVDICFYRSLKSEAVWGLSHQTLTAITFNSIFDVVKKLIQPVMHFFIYQVSQSRMDAHWWNELLILVVIACVFIGCTVEVHKNPKALQSGRDGRGDLIRDDFGGRFTRSVWYGIGLKSEPPRYLHYSLLYICACICSIFAAFISCDFSIYNLCDWIITRPSGIMAIFSNFMRGFAVLPQLQISRAMGIVPAALALWLLGLGFLDVMESVTDFFVDGGLCYLLGDLFSAIVVSDFAYICIKSRLRGSNDVEIPLALA